MAKKLIAFYSRADENYVNGMIKLLDVGNTEVAADRCFSLPPEKAGIRNGSNVREN